MSHLHIKSVPQSLFLCMFMRGTYLKANLKPIFFLTLIMPTEGRKGKVLTKTYKNNIFHTFKEMKPNAQVFKEKQKWFF